jgi:hypothetical protein
MRRSGSVRQVQRGRHWARHIDDEHDQSKLTANDVTDNIEKVGRLNYRDRMNGKKCQKS